MQRVLNLILVLIFTTTSLFVFSQDGGDLTDEEETNIFLMFFGLAAIGITIGVALVTILLSLIVLACLAMLIAGGIFSVSLGVAIYKKSVSAGIRTVLFIVSAFGGAALGAGVFWLAAKLYQPRLDHQTELIVGAVAGCLGGLLAAMGIIWMTGKIYKKFVASFSNRGAIQGNRG